jgi:hypothetical protein
MLAVAIYIKDVDTLEYNRIDLFDDEKISVTSSIQNINDISKTFTDFSQTFTVPASKQNNKIFRHWYDNSNDSPFSTLVKSDAYIEIDTITFRKGKIQLESANVEDGLAKDYSITFIGTLGNLKDKFNGLYLKDLTDTTYDFEYTPTVVKNKVVTTTTSSDIMFPLISSLNNWGYDVNYDITASATPIRYNDLFPAIKLLAVLNMIQNDSNILNLNFNGSFLSDARFTNAYLYLKNAETFEIITKEDLITFQNTSAITYSPTSGNPQYNAFKVPPLLNDTVYRNSINEPLFPDKDYKLTLTISPTVAGISYTINTYFLSAGSTFEYLLSSETKTSIVGNQTFIQASSSRFNKDCGYRYKIVSDSNITFNASILLTSEYNNFHYSYQTISKTSNQTLTASTVIPIKKYMPEIKVEDFFSGLLKMFNLTCYSTDGINYTVDTLENYYLDGSDIDITKYVIQDKKSLNRVKTHKKINFDYEKSESIINVGFNSNAGIEYGSLHYSNNPPAEGDEYSIKLPFENLNFQNLASLLQVGYALKTDFQKYIPKPVILYDYNPTALTSLGSDFFYFSTALSGSGTPYYQYKAFGQETLISGETYGLNFNQQQSTLTNESISNSLYNQYYEAYFANIFNFKARLVKVSAILPTSILTTLKLNDNVIIRGTKYLINTFTTDLTTGEVQFELLTDQRL